MAFANNHRKYLSELFSMISAGAPTCRSEEHAVPFAAVRQRSGIRTRVLLALLCSFAPFAGSTPDSSETWITDVTIISPERLDHIEKGSVLIKNGRIAKVELGNHGKNLAGAAVVVSGKGQYLIPGLIDSHVHLASVPAMKFDQDQGQQQRFQKYFRQLPRSYLYYGYTTLVDLNVVEPEVLEDFRHAPLHPDLYDCG